MIDIQLIRENPDLVKKNNESRSVDVDVDAILKLDGERRELQAKFDTKRGGQKKMSKGKPEGDDLKKLKKLKKEVKDLEKKISSLAAELKSILIQLPNVNLPGVVVGGEEANKVEREVGKKPKLENPKPHEKLGARLGWFDLERGAKVSGNRFWYLKGQAVMLQMALQDFVMRKLVQKGFTPMVVPNLVREDTLYGAGFLPAQEFEIYSVNPGEDNLFLIGTAEAPLVAYFKDETIDVKKPKRLCAFSPAYRREAGAYGKDTTGIFRGHQFDKLEMVSFTTQEDSEKEHQFLLTIEEEIISELGLPYQLVSLASGDMSPQAAQCYDIEVWLPGQNKYRELTSCSNTTDYQSRRLNIKHKTKDGLKLVHTLNGTGVAIGRTLIAILENHQDENGDIHVPKPLQAYMGVTVLKP
ncbi:MAG: serine--tRNA ligase [Parcubacteria group bacterium]|nr:serine--tRNA ligase [Parcubacteria group bacterium]